MAQPSQAEFLVSPVFPQCKAWVSVDGVDTPVYSAKVDGKKVSGYIEAREGAAFSVHFRDERTPAPKVDIVLRVYLDGQKTRGLQFPASSSRYRKPLDDVSRTINFSTAPVNDTTERSFMFGKLLTTDDDEQACTDERIAKAMGTIQLKVIRIKNARPLIAPSNDADFADIVMHEQSKKAKLSHQTALGPPVTVKHSQTWTSTLIDSSANPFTTYEFVYRSRALLELEGHAPRKLQGSSLGSRALTVSLAALPQPAVVLPPSPPLAPVIDTPPFASGSKNQKRPADIVIASDDEQEEMARLEARLDELKRRQASKGGAVDDKGKVNKDVKQEKKPDLNKVKQEGGSSGKGKGKGKVEGLSRAIPIEVSLLCRA